MPSTRQLTCLLGAACVGLVVLGLALDASAPVAHTRTSRGRAAVHMKRQVGAPSMASVHGEMNEMAGGAAPMMAMSMSRASAPAFEAAHQAADMQAPPPAQPQTEPLANDAGRVLVKNGHMSLIVESVEDAAGAVEEQALKLGGFTTSQHRGSSSGPAAGGKANFMSGSVTVRVPAKRFADLRGAVRKVGLWVESENENVDDVTDQFFDTKSRIRVLQSTVARLEAFIDKASSSSDVANLFQQVTRHQERLESLQGQLRRYSDQASLSTLTVSLSRRQDAPDPEAPDFWSPLKTLLVAAQALGGAARWCVDAGIWAIVFGLPAVFLLGLLLFAANGLARRFGVAIWPWGAATPAARSRDS